MSLIASVLLAFVVDDVKFLVEREEEEQRLQEDSAVPDVLWSCCDHDKRIVFSLRNYNLNKQSQQRVPTVKHRTALLGSSSSGAWISLISYKFSLKVSTSHRASAPVSLSCTFRRHDVV